jgi:ribonuclease P protein component
MLRKTRKLNLAWSENQLFYREFYRQQADHLVLFTRPITSQIHPVTPKKIAVVVGKTISLSAVKRNETKRKIYDFLSSQPETLLPSDIVVVIKKKAEFITYQTELTHLLNAIKSR